MAGETIEVVYESLTPSSTYYQAHRSIPSVNIYPAGHLPIGNN
jgi:hypothetical protein